MTIWLTGEVQRSLAGPGRGLIERAVFGRLDADEIIDALSATCAGTFGARLVDGFLYRVSVGVVIGCHLEDGRRVVLKAYQPRWTPPFLRAVKRVQAQLHHAGYPCPRPIDCEMSVAGATVVAEEVLPDPGVGTVTSPRAMSASAGGLAALIDRCRDIREPALTLHPLRATTVGVFPEPHSPLFDFEATQRGAEWIEDIARRAKRVSDEDRSEPVIAHTDWSLRNVRLGPSGPVAVYDWDSLALLREAEAVALAAVSWCKTGTSSDLTPGPEGIDAYIRSYEAARGSALSADQHRAARAAAVGAMAYTARCEHAIDPHEEVWTTTRPRLREARLLLA